MTDAHDRPPGRWESAAAWTLLFAGNLLVPLFVAAMIVNGSALAWAGVAAGLAPAWGVGLAAVWAGPRSRSAAFVGASVVALLQCIPLAHLVAGSLAAGLCEDLGIGRLVDFGDEADAEAYAARTPPHFTFALTVFTSIPLMALAAVVGTVCVLVTGPRAASDPNTADGGGA